MTNDNSVPCADQYDLKRFIKATEKHRQRLDIPNMQAKSSRTEKLKSGKSWKSWDEVLLDDKNKFGMDNAILRITQSG